MRPQPATPPPPDIKGPCFQCVHFLGLTAHANAGRCGKPGGEAVIARPEMGCAYWHQHQFRGAGIRTAAEWEAAHGLPVAGFDDGIKIQSWPLPLHGRHIRAIYDAAPSPEAKAIAWEVARLHDVLYRTHNAILAVAQPMPHTPARATLLRLSELLAREPGVQERIARDEAAKRRR